VAVDADTFRAVLAQWPTGVTVVTTVRDGVPHGMTASSFTSVSLDPPLVSVCIARHVTSHDLIAAGGVFAVSILGKDQVEHGKRFAGMLDLDDRFADLAVTTAVTGAPVLPEALGWLDCRVWAEYDGGDHTIFLGEVVAAGTDPSTAPLLYHGRTWGQLADVLPASATLTLVGAEDSDAAARVCVPADEIPRVTGRPHRHVIARAARAADVERAKVRRAAAVELEHSVPGRARLARLAHDLALPVRHALPSVFGSAAAPATVDSVLAQAHDALRLAPDELVLDDRAGGADPLLVREVLQRLAPVAGPTPLALRVAAGPMALANVLTALKSGVTHLDVSPPGQPYVSEADTVTMLRRMHVDHDRGRRHPVLSANV
jgi:flavin reductase (DIM6/NTAB) family NADH-FMN oxidoreductase RutF